MYLLSSFQTPSQFYPPFSFFHKGMSLASPEQSSFLFPKIKTCMNPMTMLAPLKECLRPLKARSHRKCLGDRNKRGGTNTGSGLPTNPPMLLSKWTQNNCPGRRDSIKYSETLSWGTSKEYQKLFMSSGVPFIREPSQLIPCKTKIYNFSVPFMQESALKEFVLKGSAVAQEPGHLRQ